VKCGHPSCRKKATVFGPFVGGICDDHDKEAIEDGGMKRRDIWSEHHERLGKKIA
jgi:hypothetical protein